MLNRSTRSSLLTLAIAFLLASPFIAAAVPPANAAAALPKLITSIAPDSPTGVVAGAGGVFIEDYDTGSLYHWDSTHGKTLVTASPGGANGGFLGMAVTSTAKGLRVALITIDTSIHHSAGLYYCDGVTYNGVASCSSFMLLSPSFCASMSVGYCLPSGLAFDSKANLFYVDYGNNVEVELTASTGYTTIGVTQTFPTGTWPFSIFIDKGTHYVGGASCSGNIFINGAFLVSAGGSVTGITVANAKPYGTKHPFIAVSPQYASCNPFPAYIVDLYVGVGSTPLPSTSVSAAWIGGISTNFYFSDFATGAIYKTADKA